MQNIGLALSIAYPKNFGIVCRKTIPSVKQTAMRFFFDWCPKQLIADFNKQDRIVRLVNGSEILFTSSDNPTKFRSYEIGWFHLNEASEIEEEAFSELCMRLRNPYVNPKAYRGLVDTNPTSKNHWVYKKFTSDAATYALYQASSRENKDNLPPGYIKMLEDGMSAEVARRFIDGEFSFNPVGTPVYSPQFQPRFHVGVYKYNPDRPLLRGWDFGFTHPACVFAQQDSDGRIFVLGELLGRNVSIRDFAEQVMAYTNQRFPDAIESMDYCDPAGNQRSDKGDGESTIQILTQILGHPIHNRRTRIIEGVDMIRDLLGKQSAGYFFMNFDRSCEVLIEGFLGGYHYDEKKEDVIVKDGYYEHLMDALRYLIIGVGGFVQNDVLKHYRQEYIPANSFTGY